MGIEIERTDLAAAAEAGLVEGGRADALWDFLRRRVEEDGHVRVSPSGTAERIGRAGPTGNLGLVHVLWFGGALLVLGAMTFFATIGFDAFGGGGLAIIALSYGAAFTLVGRSLWRRAELKVMGGLCITLAVGMVPLATFGIQRALGLWGAEDPGQYRGFFHWVKGGWFFMEVTTIAASVFALSRVRFPFLVVIPSVALWFMSMDVSDLLFELPSRTQIGRMSAVFGVVMLAVGWWLRRRTQTDLAFWLESFALVSLQGGLLAQSSDLVVTKLLFVGVQIGILHLSRVWQRFFPVVVASTGLLALFGDRVWRSSASSELVIALGAGAMLFAYGFFIRRRGVSIAAAFSFAFSALFSLAMSYNALDDDVLGRFAYGALSTGFVLAAVAARSRILLTGGGLGLVVLLGELAFDVFRDSMVFPLVVASIGIGVMVLGYSVQKHRQRIDAALDASLPGFLRALRVPADDG